MSSSQVDFYKKKKLHPGMNGCGGQSLQLQSRCKDSEAIPDVDVKSCTSGNLPKPF